MSGPLRTIRVLLVEDSPADAMLFQTLVADQHAWRFEVVVCIEDDVVDLLRDVDRVPDVIVVGGLADARSTMRRLRHLSAATAGCGLVLSLEFYDEETTEALASAGVHAILPKSQWNTALIANTLALVVASAERRRTESRDLLTGLLQRGVWADRVHHAIERCRRSRLPFAVMLIDIDDFKRINDTLGHDGGDRYLQEIATRLSASVREQDTVARLGGDEFGLLLEDLAYPEAALRVAGQLIQNVTAPISVQRSVLPASISVGVAIMSPDQRQLSLEWAHKAADTALYDAKRQGKNRYSLFTADMDRELLQSIRLDDDLARAARRDEFTLHYQPIIDLRSGQLEGFEALLRWFHGTEPSLSPAVFVPVLERLGMMDRVGRAVLTEALQQLARWRRMTDRDLAMHVNLSAAQVIDPQFSAMVLEMLEQLDIPPRLLVIEFTESLLVRHSDVIERECARLRRAGVRIAIDDFGTGYNSLVNLKLLRPDVIKVDRGFVDRLVESAVDAAIVRAQVVLAASLGMTLVAEGVETDQQLLGLQHAGEVHQAQGFLLGHPMSAAHIEDSFRPFRLLVDQDRARAAALVPRRAGDPPARLRTSRELELEMADAEPR